MRSFAERKSDDGQYLKSSMFWPVLAPSGKGWRRDEDVNNKRSKVDQATAPFFPGSTGSGMESVWYGLP